MPYATKKGLPADSPLTERDLDRLLTPLSDPTDAKKRLELISKWILKGWINTAQGNVVARAIGEWCKLELAEQDRRRMAELEQQVEQIMVELKLTKPSLRRVS